MAGPSQFLSVDEHGVALLWITQEGTAAASSTTAVAQDEHPPGLSPWSTLRLVVSRRMDLMQVFREELLRAPSPWSGSGAVVVGLCPGQSSSHFLFSSALCGGDVVKVNRVGRPALPAVLQCPSTANTALQDLLLRSAAELAIPMDSASWWSLSSTLPGVTVTCMAIQETRLLPRRSTKDDDADRGTENDSNQRETTAVIASHYVLVGRSDGSIHLYDMSVASPLFVWTPALHYASSLRGARSGEPITTHPVLTVAWITATQFVVVDVEGMLCVYDLAHRPPDIPIFMDDSIRELLYRGQKTGAQKNRQIVAVELSPSPMSFDFDVPTQRSTGSSHRIYATVVLMENNNRETQIHVRRVDGQWMVDTLDAAETAQRALKEWSTRVNQSMINQNQGMSLELDSSSARRK